MTPHLDRHYDAELKQLSDNLLKMGGLVEEMIAQAIKALIERESALADEVVSRDQEVDKLETEVDDLCLQMIARRQPTGSDLRFITIGLRASTDLERIGDLAVNIAQESVVINRSPQLKPYVDLPKVAAETQQMVKMALDAFVKKDVALANSVCEMDDTVDHYAYSVQEEIEALMKQDSTAISRGTRLILVAHHLERIADHATNVAEQVIFMIEGKDIRHSKGIAP